MGPTCPERLCGLGQLQGGFRRFGRGFKWGFLGRPPWLKLHQRRATRCEIWFDHFPLLRDKVMFLPARKRGKRFCKGTDQENASNLLLSQNVRMAQHYSACKLNIHLSSLGFFGPGLRETTTVSPAEGLSNRFPFEKGLRRSASSSRQPRSLLCFPPGLAGTGNLVYLKHFSPTWFRWDCLPQCYPYPLKHWAHPAFAMQWPAPQPAPLLPSRHVDVGHGVLGKAGVRHLARLLICKRIRLTLFVFRLSIEFSIQSFFSYLSTLFLSVLFLLSGCSTSALTFPFPFDLLSVSWFFPFTTRARRPSVQGSGAAHRRTTFWPVGCPSERPPHWSLSVPELCTGRGKCALKTGSSAKWFASHLNMVFVSFKYLARAKFPCF